MDLQGSFVQGGFEYLGGAREMLLGCGADTVVVDGLEAESTDEVVDETLMRGEPGDQLEGDAFAFRLAAGRGGTGGSLSGFPGHGCDPFHLMPGGPVDVMPASAPSGAVVPGRA